MDGGVYLYSELIYCMFLSICRKFMDTTSNDAVAKESLGAVLSCVAREAKHSEIENTGKRLAFLRKECASW